MATIAIIGALEKEIMQIKEELSDVCEAQEAGLTVVSGEFDGLTLVATTAGEGARAGCPLSHGCRLGRPLGNVPPGRSGPRRGSQVGAPPKACAKPSLASPFGGRWCPVGTVQRLVSAAASVGDGRSPLGCITRAGRRECHAKGMTERATRPRRARAPVVRTGVSVAHRPKARIDSGGTPPAGKDASLFP